MEEPRPGRARRRRRLLARRTTVARTPSATKFAIVAPVVSTPPQVAGSPNSSFSQSIATVLEPAGERGGDPRARRSGRAPRSIQSAAERGRRRPAVDEVEELRPGGVHRAVDPGQQLLERTDGADAVLGERAAEPRGDLVGARIADGSIGDALQVCGGLACGEVDDVVELGRIWSVHVADATPQVPERCTPRGPGPGA